MPSPRLLLLVAAATLVVCEETCLSGEDDPYLHFGTKTAYTFVAQPSSANSRPHEIIGCKPIAFWLLNRHGSNNPEVEEIPGLQNLQVLKDNIINNYKNRNFRSDHKMCQADIDLLERWQWNPKHNETYAGALTSDGYISTQQLAQAWRARFPQILTDNRHDYLFKFTEDSRSKNSFKAFTEGLFRAQAEGYGIPTAEENKLLRPYKQCPRWESEVGNNEETLRELHIFESKLEFKEMITNISLRMGYNYDVTLETIYNIHTMCAYNKAWDVVQISPWCSVFTRDDLLKLEYAKDLETDYMYGYGSAVNSHLGCQLVRDMMDFITTHVDKGDIPQQPRAQILFTDAPTLLMTLATLGAHSSATPLTGDNFRAPKSHARKWYSSVMAPFNANLAAVLYKCSTSNVAEDPYKVLFLENEQQMYLPMCRVGLCDWSVVKQKFANTVKICAGSSYCNSGFRSQGVVGLSLVAAGVLVRWLG